MWLDCSPIGRVDLQRITPTSVFVANPIDFPAGEVTLFVSVDGQVMSRRVELSNGLSKHQAEAVIMSVDNVAPF